MTEPVPTKVRLAEALREAGANEAMIARAQAGYYDDYESPLAMPLTQLMVDLRVAAQYNHSHATAAKLWQLAEDVKHGKYDGTAEEADAWFKSEEGRETLAEFAKGSAKTEDTDAGGPSSQD